MPAGARVLAALCVWAVAALGQAGEAAPFRVFDGMNFAAKPDLRALGLLPIEIVYEASLFDPKSGPDGEVSPERLRAVGSRTAKSEIPVVLDVERWAGLPDARNRYATLIARVRRLNPERTFGYYAVVPKQDYWRANSTVGGREFEQWKKENDAMQVVADSVDVVYPSLYTFYDDPLAWVHYATANLREARRIARGKPVIAFLWPMYHESNEALRGRYLSREYWRIELDTARRYADGIVIWGGGSTWNGNAPWWQETLLFLKSAQVGR